MSAFLDFWWYYADFKGKTTIKGFWIAFWILVVSSLVLMFLSIIIALAAFHVSPEQAFDIGSGIFGVYEAVSIVPLLAITVRRLRDAGYSAKNFLWLLLPGIGIIAFLARLCTKSKTESVGSK